MFGGCYFHGGVSIRGVCAPLFCFRFVLYCFYLFEEIEDTVDVSEELSSSSASKPRLSDPSLASGLLLFFFPVGVFCILRFEVSYLLC